MSLFRVIKYSSLLFLLGKHKIKVFRIVAMLSFAAVTSLLYDDVATFLAAEYPQTLVYALVTKLMIVYSALLFVLWQFKPAMDRDQGSPRRDPSQKAMLNPVFPADGADPSVDRLAAFSDLDKHSDLQSRADRLHRRQNQ